MPRIKGMEKIASGEKHNLAVTSAYKVYKIAANVAQTEFTATHPLRLGLALNFSVFYDKILNSHDRARRLVKHGLHDALAELDTLAEEPDGDSILIMHLLNDNLVLQSKINCCTIDVIYPTLQGVDLIFDKG
ncbi:hypothetical protein AU210_012378 [Fusarium oxysporum f. sp. radicis-cucumerinum]|uniref:14-3-3 domain-containing protein n=1 Tax=Fusarium oxysporum f. sp. radicis-cucumerinum TaxID=327505 RepID=A0A2H3GGS9_FUSOX|nr:14-3-3 protein-domain-containing protein [Fusarium oxysporum]PCD25944.1 hypothetical protein AU210_012378 [Fusarium oxysporum f. sp. radicis-cucumerinum]